MLNFPTKVKLNEKQGPFLGPLEWMLFLGKFYPIPYNFWPYGKRVEGHT